MPTETLNLRNFQGVNLQEDARNIEDNELTWCRDGYPVTDGVIATRPGIELLQSVADAFPFPDVQAGPMRLVRFAGNWYLWHRNTDGNQQLSFVSVDWSTLTEVKEWSGLTSPAYIPEFFEFDTQLYVTSPEIGLLKVSAAGEGTEPDGIPRSVVIGAYKGQLLLAGLADAPRGIQVFNIVGTVGQPLPNTEVVDADTVFEVQGEDSDPITAVHEVSIQGGSQYVESYLVVFRSRSVYVVNGDLPTGADDEEPNFTIVPILQGEGCPYKETIVQTPYGLMWASHKDVWFLPQGGTPVRVGEKLSDLVQRRQGGLLGDWSACYSPNGFYKLMMPAPTTPDVFALPQREQWWADLRKMPKIQPRWWGPQTLAPDAHSVTGSDELMVAASPLTVQADEELMTDPNAVGAIEYTPTAWANDANTLAHYPLNEVSGPMVESVSGTSSGSPAGSPTGVAGLFGLQRDFNDATDDRIGHNRNMADFNAHTVMGWVTLDTTPGVPGSTFLWLTNSASGAQLEVNIDSSRAYRVKRLTGSYAGIAGGPHAALGVKHHFAWTYNGSGSGKFFVNGVEVDSDVPVSVGAIGAGSGTQTFRVGDLGVSIGDAANAFNGKLEDIVLLNVALTPSQVAAVYANGVPGVGVAGINPAWTTSGVTPIDTNTITVVNGSYIEQAVTVPAGSYVLITLNGTKEPNGVAFSVYDRSDGDAAPGTLLSTSDFNNGAISSPVRSDERVLLAKVQHVTTGTANKATYLVYRVPVTADAQAGTLVDRVFRITFTSAGTVSLDSFSVATAALGAAFFSDASAVPADSEDYSTNGPPRTAIQHAASISVGEPAPDWRFKDLDFGQATLEKLVDRFELSAWVDRELAVAAKYLKSQGGQGLQDGSKTLTPLGVVLGTAVLGTDALADGPDDWAVYPTDGRRVVAKSIQPQLTFEYGGVKLFELGVRIRPLGRRPSK